MTEILLGLLIFIGLALAGYAVLKPFPSAEIGIAERLLLGLTVSIAVFPFLVFYVLLIGARLDTPLLFWILPFGALIGIFFLFVDLRRKNQERSAPSHSTQGLHLPPIPMLLIGVIFLLLSEKLIFTTIQGLSFPTYFWDAIATWNYRAKVIYYEGILVLNPESHYFMGGWKPHYALGPSIFRAWMATMVGSWSDQVVVLDSFVAYIALFALIWMGALWKIGKWYSLIFAYLAVSLPLMVHHAYAGYADLLLTLFFTGCIIYGYTYLTTRDLLAGVVSLLFLSGALFTKNEGVILIFPVFLIAVLFTVWKGKLSIRAAMVFLATPVFFILPWILLKAYLSLGYAPAGTGTIVEFHPEGLIQLFGILFLQGSFNLFGLFFILSTLYFLTTWWKTDLSFLALPIFLFLAAILSVFLFTSNYTFLENQMTINRTLMLFMPSYIYLVGLSFGIPLTATYPDKNAP